MHCYIDSTMPYSDTEDRIGVYTYMASGVLTKQIMYNYMQKITHCLAMTIHS